MNALNNYLYVLSKYFVFTGRSSRKEFWYYQLITSVITIILVCIDEIGGLYFDTEIWFYGILTSLYFIAVAIPSWALLVRRIHDVGKSGWIVFPWVILPYIGQFYLFYLYLLCVKKGDLERNKYGDPTMVYTRTNEETSQEIPCVNETKDFIENEPVTTSFSTEPILANSIFSEKNTQVKISRKFTEKYFPFKKKGIYRLYIAFSIIISFFVGARRYREYGEYNIEDFVVTLVLIGCIYFVSVWIYNGFKE